MPPMLQAFSLPERKERKRVCIFGWVNGVTNFFISLKDSITLHLLPKIIDLEIFLLWVLLANIIFGLKYSESNYLKKLKVLFRGCAYYAN